MLSRAWQERAPAKINLTLHVLGRYQDGRHAIDSLAVFPDQADVVQFFPQPTTSPSNETPLLSLQGSGPFAHALPSQRQNLVYKAAVLVQENAVHPELVRGRIYLHKNLPVGAGLGGGSANAAAVLRGFSPHSSLLAQRAPGFAHRLGADVPACLHARSCRMQGIGSQLSFVRIPPIPTVLVWPRVELETVRVYTAFAEKKKTSETHVQSRSACFSSRVRRMADWIAQLRTARNDLEKTAIHLCPQIGEVLRALQSRSSCMLARMSGSGSSCFGLFPSLAAARQTAVFLARSEPGWWVRIARWG